MTCPRKAYYAYELGLKPIVDAEPLRFGTAWHAAMQARWQGKSIDEAFECAINSAKELDEQVIAIISGLLAGYYHHWGDATNEGETLPEQEFRHPIERSMTFDSAGKIDCIIKGQNRIKLLEHKTTSDDLSEDSMYWHRLKFNMQLYQYFFGAKSLGYEIDEVTYDVVRKPMIQIKNSIPELDEAGRRIVIGPDGNRVYKKDGTPRESADTKTGAVVKTRRETKEEFSQRLADDCIARPEFYFARKQVPVLMSDLEAFTDQRLEIGKQILHYRARQKIVGVAGWPRNVQFWTCGRLCPYDSFCLQGLDVNPQCPPMGFEVRAKNEELSNIEAQ